MIRARKAANSLYDVRMPTAPISNPPSMVPPPVPTPTNRPFRIPEKIKRGKVALLFYPMKSTELGGQFIQPVLINTLLVASLTQLVSSLLRDTSETFLPGKLVEYHAQIPVR